MDMFLQDAMECETDAISDGTHAFVPTVMQHIEQAGIHSGDSACVIPSVKISEKNKETIRKYTTDIACEMGVVGLMNMQYAIYKDTVYVLEANPRASRTVPLGLQGLQHQHGQYCHPAHDLRADRSSPGCNQIP